MCTRVLLVLALFLSGGCVSKGSYPIGSAQKDLKAGIADYENGNYRTAENSLKGALNDGLFFKTDEIMARKYLAFIHCASARQGECRGEFQKILELDPQFELTVAEAGHPAWGPVFRRLKAQETR